MIWNSGAHFTRHFMKSCHIAPNLLGNTEKSSHLPVIKVQWHLHLRGKKTAIMQQFHTLSTVFNSMFEESTFRPNFQQTQVYYLTSSWASDFLSTALHICVQILLENLQAVHNRKERQPGPSTVVCKTLAWQAMKSSVTSHKIFLLSADVILSMVILKHLLVLQRGQVTQKCRSNNSI